MTGAADLFVSPAVALERASGVAVYGAGSAGREAAEALRAAGVRVRAVLDRWADRMRPVGPLAVEAPDAAAAERLRGVPVLLGVFNPEVDVVSLARTLAEAGFGPFVSFVSLHAHLRGALSARYWLADPGDPAAAERGASEARSLLADERSVALFDALLAFRRSGDYRDLPAPEPESVYLPNDVPGWLAKQPVRLLDGGAFDGDTLARYRRAGVAVSAAACFEPDPGSYARLVERTRDGNGWPELLLWPCALSTGAGRLRFASGLGMSSRVETTGECEVPCVSLDESLPGFAPTLVKLDVEGAELEALEGMARTIERHRPDLALSVYHLPDHLWRIPAWVAARGLGHRLYLRSHAWSGFETVLYAVA